MLKKIMNGLDAISIMSWVVTMMVMCVIWYLSINDVSFKWAWNDFSRFYDSGSIVSMLYKLVVWVIALAGSTNLVSTIIRKLADKTDEKYELVDEFEEEESN